MKFEDISYRYRRGQSLVVRDLSWEVPHGHVVLLGPNGAGKSTLLALAGGVFSAQSGHCVIAGHRSGKSPGRSYRALVGWMPQTVRPVRGLRVLEQVAFAGWLHGLDRRTAERRAGQTLELVDLAEHRDKKSHELSGGQLRRLGLAEVLAHEPQQLLLDEPTAGLDPAQRIRFAEILSRLPDDVDVLVSTHQVDDLEDSYDAVAVMSEGVLRFTGDPAQFIAHAPADARRPADEAYAVIAGAPSPRPGPRRGNQGPPTSRHASGPARASSREDALGEPSSGGPSGGSA